jgi:hypothetical protein
MAEPNFPTVRHTAQVLACMTLENAADGLRMIEECIRRDCPTACGWTQDEADEFAGIFADAVIEELADTMTLSRSLH